MRCAGRLAVSIDWLANAILRYDFSVAINQVVEFETSHDLINLCVGSFWAREWNSPDNGPR